MTELPASEFLSLEQQHLVDAPGELFVEACPGAGKTRAIVARFVRRASEEPRKGIALLSFTNAAIDEARRRTRLDASTELLRPPHYVGTFDSFINRFITTPVFAGAKRKAPGYVEEWSELYAGKVGAKQMQGAPLSLDCFTFDSEGNASLVPSRVGEIYARRKRAVECSPQLEYLAAEAFARLIEGGTFACSASRWYATRSLETPGTGSSLLQVLAARFAEVIVDEGQDCDERELAILRALRSAGLNIVMVADFDQAIYEFRDAQPELVRLFASQLPSGTRLSGNYRSSPAICSLTTSLRHEEAADDAVGQHRECETSIHVLPYNEISELRDRLRGLAGTEGVEPGQIVVLSHRGNDARAAAGQPPHRAVGESVVARIAEASLTLRSLAASAREKELASARLERALIETREGIKDAPLDQTCAQAGVPRAWLRAAAGRLALALDPRATERTTYAAEVRQFIGGLGWPGTTLSKPLGGVAKAPNSDKWDALTAVEAVEPLAGDTIHSFKGREELAVAVVLPKKLRTDDEGLTVLDRWESRENAEVRRVLYVGVSRAQRLLMVGIHDNHLEQLQRILTRDGVPYVLAA